MSNDAQRCNLLISGEAPASAVPENFGFAGGSCYASGGA